MGNKASKRKSSKQTDLMIPCKTGNVAAVREILEWRDDDDEGVDISARDKNGQTALSLAKQSNNAEIVAMIVQKLFLRAVENNETKTVKTYLTAKESNQETLYCRVMLLCCVLCCREQNYEIMEIQPREEDLSQDTPRRKFKTEFNSLDSITLSVWLKAVATAACEFNDEMLNLLLDDQRFVHGFNEDGQTILHQYVEKYFRSSFMYLTTI